MTTDHVRHVPPADLGPMLRTARARAGFGLREAARRAGLSHPYLQRLENGARCPSTGVVEGLAEALCLTEDERRRLAETAVDDVGRAHPLRQRASP